MIQDIDPREHREAVERIAFGSTKAMLRPRWTELSVWYLHEPLLGPKRWLVETAGLSNIDGENTRRTRFAAGTLDRALKMIDQDGHLGKAVAEEAREWAENHRVLIENGKGGLIAFADDQAALDWLYGGPDQGHKGYAKMLARDLGCGESTARMQIAAGRPLMIPLRSILAFVDREAFRRARAAENARG